MTISLIFLLTMIPVFHLYIKNITGRTRNDGTKNVEILVPLKYLSNFWILLGIPLINCRINLIWLGLQIAY